MIKRVTIALLLLAITSTTAQSLPRRRAVRPVPTPCGTMTDANVFFFYFGSTSFCSSASLSPCTIGESVDFGIQSFGYNFLCDAHTVHLDFGDGTSIDSVPGVRITHTYAQPGMYIAIASVGNHTQTLLLGTRVFVNGG